MPVIQFLSSKSLHQMLRLQDAVHSALPDNERSSIVLKSRESVHALLDDPHYAVGAFTSGGTLIGQMIVAVVSEFREKHGLVVCATSRGLVEEGHMAGIVQGVLVHPEWRQRGVMKAMLENVSHAASARNIKVLLAEVAAHNAASATGFLHHGYRKAGEGTDLEDGTPLVFFRHYVASSGQLAANKLHEIISRAPSASSMSYG